MYTQGELFSERELHDCYFYSSRGELFSDKEMHDCYSYSSRRVICFWLSKDMSFYAA